MYTNTPDVSTYRTTRFNFSGTPEGRNGTTTSKDQRFVNFFIESIRDPYSEERRVWLRQRPGMVHSVDVGVTGTGRGIVYFNGSLYTAIGNKLYRDTTEVATLGNSSGRVGFTQFNGTYTALIVLDGIKGFVIKTDNTVAEITDVDFPTPHLPFPIFIDGYLFVAKDGTDDIYNCDLEDPLTWTPGNFITAELYPDKLVGLSKNNNYLVALGEKTVEHFYDNANASGSPLQRNDSAVQQMGCPAPNTIVTSDVEVFFVGSTDNGGRTVWSLSGFQPTEIAIPVVRQSLDAEGSSISSASAQVVRSSGHKFLLLTTTTRTWAYDIDEQKWHEWTYSDDTTPFICTNSCDHPDGNARMLHPSNGNVMKLSADVAHDAITSTTNTTIYSVLTTHKMDFGSNNRKFCGRLSVVGDAPNGSTDVALSVQWSDDDYVTWSAARTVQLHGDLQAITQLGMFRRRAFKFIYNQDYPLRLQGFELDINIGQA